jgi:hypothetical protein
MAFSGGKDFPIQNCTRASRLPDRRALWIGWQHGQAATVISLALSIAARRVSATRQQPFCHIQSVL